MGVVQRQAGSGQRSSLWRAMGGMLLGSVLLTSCGLTPPSEKLRSEMGTVGVQVVRNEIQPEAGGDGSANYANSMNTGEDAFITGVYMATVPVAGPMAAPIVFGLGAMSSVPKEDGDSFEAQLNSAFVKVPMDREFRAGISKGLKEKGLKQVRFIGQGGEGGLTTRLEVVIEQADLFSGLGRDPEVWLSLTAKITMRRVSDGKVIYKGRMSRWCAKRSLSEYLEAGSLLSEEIIAKTARRLGEGVVDHTFFAKGTAWPGKE